MDDVEKEEAIRKLEAMKGSLKGKAKMSDEEAGRLATEGLIKKFNPD